MRKVLYLIVLISGTVIFSSCGSFLEDYSYSPVTADQSTTPY